MKYSILSLPLALLLLSCSDDSKESSSTKQFIGKWVGVEYNEFFEMDGEMYHDEYYSWDPYTTSYSDNEYVTFNSETNVTLFSYYDDKLQPENYTYFARKDSLFINGFGDILWGTYRFSGDTLIIDNHFETDGEYIAETSYIQYQGVMPGLEKEN